MGALTQNLLAVWGDSPNHCTTFADSPKDFWMCKPMYKKKCNHQVKNSVQNCPEVHLLWVQQLTWQHALLFGRVLINDSYSVGASGLSSNTKISNTTLKAVSQKHYSPSPWLLTLACARVVKTNPEIMLKFFYMTWTKISAQLYICFSKHSLQAKWNDWSPLLLWQPDPALESELCNHCAATLNGGKKENSFD